MSPTDPALPEAAFSVGKAFNVLFLTMGPFNVIAAFAALTRGRDWAFTRRLALEGIVLAAFAALISVTVGVSVLSNWNISLAALRVTAGVILFLIALRTVLAQMPGAPAPTPPKLPDAAGPSRLSLAASPLAFPTIITPYGIAVLVLLAALTSESAQAKQQLIGLTAVVLVLDFIAMLSAQRILRTPYVALILGIIGAVIGVLQIALGVQVMADGLRLLGLTPA